MLIYFVQQDYVDITIFKFSLIHNHSHLIAKLVLAGKLKAFIELNNPKHDLPEFIICHELSQPVRAELTYALIGSFLIAKIKFILSMIFHDSINHLCLIIQYVNCKRCHRKITAHSIDFNLILYLNIHAHSISQIVQLIIRTLIVFHLIHVEAQQSISIDTVVLILIQ